MQRERVSNIALSYDVKGISIQIQIQIQI